jgi:hypothetical protein
VDGVRTLSKRCTTLNAMSRLQKVLLVIGTGYLAALCILFMRGAGLLAGYLAIPGWLIVGGVLYRAPDQVFDPLTSSSAAQFAVLVISGAINMAGLAGVVYLMRWFLRTP